MKKRKWLFKVKDFESNWHFLDEEANEIEEKDAIAFIGNDDEARAEADRRADLWEQITSWLVHYAEMVPKGDAE